MDSSQLPCSFRNKGMVSGQTRGGLSRRGFVRRRQYLHACAPLPAFASKDDVVSCDMQECCVCHANRLLL